MEPEAEGGQGGPAGPAAAAASATAVPVGTSGAVLGADGGGGRDGGGGTATGTGSGCTGTGTGSGGGGHQHQHAVRSKPVVVMVVGMAGSGKTTLMHRLSAHVREKRIRTYMINLDPAVRTVPYPANIDIRDTVNYKNVMKEYHLGPNGGILTSLNLFATKIHEVIALVEKRADDLDLVLVDTPGQIEIFTWSASGSVVTEAFASTFPTLICYVVDTPRATAPATFMSNMLYACGILYKMRLPLVLAFTKTDITKHGFALEWMDDFEAFQQAVDERDSANYSSSFNRSLCLVLDEFYRNLKAVGVSSITGEGIAQLVEAFKDGADEYAKTYGLEVQRRIEEKQRREEERQRKSMESFRKDAAGMGEGASVASTSDSGLEEKTKSLSLSK